MKTRIIPNIKQRAIHKEIQLTPIKKEDQRQGMRKAGEQKMSLKLESNYRRVEQKIYEKVLYHSYYGEIKNRI